MSDPESSEPVRTQCLGCDGSFPLEALKALPVWVEDVGAFVTNRFCADCYPAAAGELSRNLANPDLWKKLNAYLELHGLGRADGAPGAAESKITAMKEEILKLPEEQREAVWKLILSVFGDPDPPDGRDPEADRPDS
jgi:hypothetical protein